MWLAEMGAEADAAVVDERMKEDGFQVGCMMLSTVMLGHYVTRLGRVTPQDSALEDC